MNDNLYSFNRLSLFIILIIFSLCPFNLSGYSDGPPNGLTGQPPESATCALTRQCHAGEVSPDGGVEISIDGNPEAFVSGDTYTVTVTVNDPVAACFGFQIGVQFLDDGTNAGNFEVPEGAVGYENIGGNLNYQYVEHNMPSTTGVWSFFWTAPNNSENSDIIFYAAGVVANCDGEPVTDATYTTSKRLKSACGGIIIERRLRSNVLDIECDFSTGKPRAALGIESIRGGAGNYTINPFGESTVSQSTISEGDSFYYYFTQNDADNGNVGFTVSDEEGHICALDEQTVISISSFATICEYLCSFPVIAEIEGGTDSPIINCDNSGETTKYQIAISSVSGGFGEYNLTLNGGSVDPLDNNIENGFIYEFTQIDIDGGNVSFVIDDGGTCSKFIDFNDIVNNVDVNANCACTLSYTFLMDETSDIVVNCEEQGDELIGSININNVTGGSSSYLYTATMGTIINASNQAAGSFDYTFTQIELDSGMAGFTIEDDGGNCSEFVNISVLLNIQLNNICSADCNLVAIIDRTKNITCFGENDGSISIAASSSNEPLVFEWFLNGTLLPGLSGSENNTLSKGTYEINIADAENCQTTVSATVIEPGQLQISSIADFLCNEVDFTFATNFEIAGGTGILSVTASEGDLMEIDIVNYYTIENIPNGSFASIIIEDENQCSVEDVIGPHICGPHVLPCYLETSISNTNNVSCNGKKDGSISIMADSRDLPLSYQWFLNGTEIPETESSATNLAKGYYEIRVSDSGSCSIILNALIDEPDPLIVLASNDFACSDGNLFYSTSFNVNGAVGDITTNASYGSIATRPNNSYIIENIPNNTSSVISVKDENNCETTQNIGPHNCESQIAVQPCETSAGELRPVDFDTFCTLSAEVVMPVQFGYNINLDYTFIIVNSNQDVVRISSEFRVSMTGLPADEYCIYGLSYEENATNAPNLNITSLSQLEAQSTACYSITRSCITITIQEVALNEIAPTSSIDTVFYCTGYTVPIDFCIDIEDADGGQPYLVDIISFCNPTIEGDSCVHYPPLPGLLPGDTEVISLIYCDDDCPQLCDTSYASITILDDCTDFMPPEEKPVTCISDTTYTCAELSVPLELCSECTDTASEYFISNVTVDSGAGFEIMSGNCLMYNAPENIESDTIVVELCSWDFTVGCVNKVFVADIGNCNPASNCPEIFACTPPVVEIEICLECEAQNFPGYSITDVESKFDQCTINLVKEMCFDYIPLPLMNILETDTALVTYCNERTGDCKEAQVYITYENCDGGGLLQTIEAQDDYFEAVENESLELNILNNDVEQGISSSSVLLNVTQSPTNGSINISANEAITYTPNSNFTGQDRFIYEICENGNCDQAEVIIDIYPANRTINEDYLVKAYPNPVKSELNVKFNTLNNTFIKLSLYNSVGKAVYKKKKIDFNGTQSDIIDVSTLERGIYILNVTFGDKQESNKILVD